MDCPFTNASLVSSRDMLASFDNTGDGAVGDTSDIVVTGVQDAMNKNTKPYNIDLMAYLLFSLPQIAR
jgi:hypothetical protein